MTSSRGHGAAAVTPHALATDAAMEMMASGGNAVDAAIAANAVLGVVAPETCGIGGDLFALVHAPGMNAPMVLNASGRAGSGADAEGLRSLGHTTLPSYHPATVTIPGCVDGWHALAQRFGRKSLEEDLASAIRLATDGFPASHELSRALSARHLQLSVQASAASLLPGGNPPVPGDQLSRSDLAATLRSVGMGTRDDFYLGQAGEAISAATGGVITTDDLQRNQADWVEPLSLRVFGLTGWTVPPNSQGYLTLAAASVFESLSPPADPELVESWHLAIESYRAVAWDRNDVLADPAHSVVASNDLVEKSRLQRQAAAIDPSRSGSFAVPAPKPAGTAYLCAIDAEGLGVSFIQSNFMGIGSGIGAGSSGFLLHNRGAGFDLRAGHPNELGPGKRPLHTLSPSLWTRDNTLVSLLGTRGGDYQPQLLLQVAIRIFHGLVEPGVAQGRPRWMIDQFADTRPVVAVEGTTPRNIIDGLTSRGHNVSIRSETQHGWGPVSVITVDRDGLRIAAADPRVDTALARAS